VQPGLVHHSDRGSQYASGDYTQLLADNGISISMSRKANPWDNAPCESFMKTLNYEEVHRNEYRDLDEARRSIAQFLEKVYNNKRLHSALGYLPPAQGATAPTTSKLFADSGIRFRCSLSKWRPPGGDFRGSGSETSSQFVASRAERSASSKTIRMRSTRAPSRLEASTGSAGSGADAEFNFLGRAPVFICRMTDCCSVRTTTGSCAALGSAPLHSTSSAARKTADRTNSDRERQRVISAAAMSWSSSSWETRKLTSVFLFIARNKRLFMVWM